MASFKNDVTQKVLDDYTTAPIDDKLRATLHFLKKFTLDHDKLGSDDAKAVLATGVTREALVEAMNVAFLFNIYDRLADTMGWDVPAAQSGFYESSAQMLLKRGYNL